MPSQQLLLNWKDHNVALVSVFENLLTRKTLVDCTLAAEGQYLKAHKVVLSACSSYFELLFSQESEKNPIVILKDVKFQELKAAVDFMYQGEVEVSEDRLQAFLDVADSLQIKGLGNDEMTHKSGKSLSQKRARVAAPPKPYFRKEVAPKQSKKTQETYKKIVESCITLDSDEKSNNESSSHHQLPHRETSGSSPIPSSFTIASSYIVASASTSCPVGTETHHDGDNLENNQCSSSSVSIFPVSEAALPEVNTIIKTESETDTYLAKKSDETGRDFDEIMMEDQNDPHIESMGDDHSASQHDPGHSVAHIKTEQSPLEPMANVLPMEHIAADVARRSVDVGRWGPRAQRRGPFLCHLCAHVSPQLHAWVRHQRIHTGEKPYKCPFCKYATTQKGNLNVHIRKHTGETPYKCSECDMYFKYTHSLRRHKRDCHTVVSK